MLMLTLKLRLVPYSLGTNAKDAIRCLLSPLQLHIEHRIMEAITDWIGIDADIGFTLD
jgi:hypothetical protein